MASRTSRSNIAYSSCATTIWGSGSTRFGEPLIVRSVCSLPPSSSVASAPAFLRRKGTSVWNCWSRARAVESAFWNGADTPRKYSRCLVESAAVMGGPSAFHTGAGGRSITKAPLACRRWAARLSGVEPSMRTTGPRIVLPFEPGAQAQLAAITSCTCGAVIRTERAPRSHLPPKFHCSSCAASPYSWNFLIVQSLAARAAGDPVRRGPITSARYCRLRITWERFSASSIRRPTPEVSTVGFWAAPGRTARAPSSASAAARHTRFTGETLGGWSCLKVRGGRGVCLTRGSLLLVAALPRDRQRDGHGGADPDRRIDGDAPAEHVPHDAVHDHEAHPASLAKLLRREPGLEDAVEIRGAASSPRISTASSSPGSRRRSLAREAGWASWSCTASCGTCSAGASPSILRSGSAPP